MLWQFLPNGIRGKLHDSYADITIGTASHLLFEAEPIGNIQIISIPQVPAILALNQPHLYPIILQQL